MGTLGTRNLTKRTLNDKAKRPRPASAHDLDRGPRRCGAGDGPSSHCPVHDAAGGDFGRLPGAWRVSFVSVSLRAATIIRGMTQHSIATAAKLVGRSPKTIYRLVKQGFLSATLDENGKKQIDTSELLRVFGELRTGREKTENPETIPMSQREIPEATARMAVLEAEMRLMRELLESKDAQIADLRKTVLLLEHRSAQEPRRKGFFDRWRG